MSTTSAPVDFSDLESQVIIYGLIDPENNQLKYIGKTIRALSRRLTEHVCITNLKPNTYKNNWIKQCLSNGYKPEILELSKTCFNSWKEEESFWISYAKFIGCKLTNLTSGGDGLNNPSESVRYKCGASRRGKTFTFSEEHKNKLAKANRDRVKNPEWLRKAKDNLAKNRNLKGHCWSKESRKKASDSAKKRSSLTTLEERKIFSQLGVEARRIKNVSN